MIRLFNNWAIDGDGRQFIVGKLKTKKNKTTGEEVEVLKEEGYCSSLQSSIDFIAKAELTKAVHENDFTLKEALAYAKELAMKIDSIVRDENFPEEAKN